MQKLKISFIAQALHTIQTSDNETHKEFAQERLDRELSKMPSGSGIDTGCHLLETSRPERIVFKVPFHHMDQNGYYCGWTDYYVILKPSFLRFGIDMKITGRDKNMVKDYLYDLFSELFEI